jgi:apolipoprotein N-acyltransferase
MKQRVPTPLLHVLVFGASVLAAGMFAILMERSWQATGSWHSLTLGLFLSIWIGLLAMQTIRWRSNMFKWRLLGLSLIAGFLLWLGFPPSPFTPLMAVAFVPVCMVQREIEIYNAQAENRPIRPGFFFFHAFLLWNMLSTYWVANAELAAGIFANTANAALMTLPFLLWHHTRKFMSGSVTRIALISYWLAFEYIHHNWELAWPWLSLGNALGEWPVLAQWYAWTGVTGGSLWILMTNIFIFRLVRHYYYGIPIKKRGVTRALFLWLVIPVAISLLLLLRTRQSERFAEVVIVQPNTNPFEQTSRSGGPARVRHLLSLAEPLLTDSTDFLIFPEAALGPADKSRVGTEGETGLLKDWLRNHPGLQVITGLTLIEWFSPTDTLPPFIREFKNENGPLRHYAVYNAAVGFDGTLAEPRSSYKSKLVPGAETFPYRQFLGFLDPLLQAFGAGGSGFGTQSERSIFQSASGTVSPLICYESAFGEFVTGFVSHGAEALIIITNDSWWGRTAGHRQHLRLASLRAIETGRAIARCANGGISALIAPDGSVTTPTSYGHPTAISGPIPLFTHQTFYTKFGDLPGRIALILTLLLTANLLAKRLTP